MQEGECGSRLEITQLSIETLSIVEKIENESSASPWSEKLLREEFASESSAILGARIGESLVGFLVLRVEAGEAHVLNVAVLPGSRRKGIGEALVNKACELVLGNGAKKLLLEVRASNHGAKSLYEACGFTKVGTRKGYYSDTGEDAILMTKELFCV